MASKLDALLEPGERVVWRDPRSVLRFMWPYLLMTGALATVLLGPASRGVDVWNWSWDAALFPVVGMTGVVVMTWILERIDGRPVEGAVTGGRVLYRREGNQPLTVELDLAEIAAVAVTAEGAVEITRCGGETVLLPQLRRPQRFAYAVAEAARAPASGLLGRLDLFSTNCWMFGGMACVIVVELLTNTITSGGPPWGLFDVAGLVLYGMAVWGAALWLGAHLACVFGLAVLRSRVGADEVRVWLDTRPSGGHASRIYRWGLWKSRPYFRLAALLWGEPMNGPEEGANAHG